MNWIKKVYRFYRDGFRGLSDWGRTMWIIILLKLFVMFAILKLFFFTDTLKNKYDTDEERAQHVLEELITH
ncbi:DUF4492 domain-containing protein [Carboxylicivirga sp. N1Y90]|uniref:DUF4492 domain-containing protein n=1 Tax=Carboxylicivirga fragile TaxID=3417571 RepID=UPI003D32FC6A|nr:DUF4492 domain-containing protein [Marinilabiliaceae bacterium N1Y90]